MRPPLKKRIGLPETPLLEPMPTTDSKAEALEEKRQLAKHLHNQAINPLRWTEAHPASQSDQQTYQASGQKPRGNQFDVKGKLYNWSPDVTATPQQAKAITDAYMAERSGTVQKETGPAIDKLVEVEKVPLTPPFGTRHKNRIANDMNAAEERKALFRHYAQSGVDPDKAHLGDPLPMKDQERLKAEIKKISSGASDPIKAPHASEIAQNHETLAACAIFAFLWSIRKRPMAVGQIFAIYLILAGIERLLVEFIRLNDLYAGLSQAQWISVGMIAAGSIMIYRNRTAPKEEFLPKPAATAKRTNKK